MASVSGERFSVLSIPACTQSHPGWWVDFRAHLAGFAFTYFFLPVRRWFQPPTDFELPPPLPFFTELTSLSIAIARGLALFPLLTPAGNGFTNFIESFGPGLAPSPIRVPGTRFTSRSMPLHGGSLPIVLDMLQFFKSFILNMQEDSCVKDQKRSWIIYVAAFTIS
jgi:hypothetical protein